MGPASEPDVLHEALGGLNARRTTTVLHVDDEPDFADLVAIYLEREDDSLEVITETDAESGLERLETTDVDCIVSDYDMPHTNGLEFLEAVRERDPDIPFILFTGKGSEEIASEAISAGVTDYLQKGGGSDQYTVLANRVKNAAQQYHAEREIERGFQAIETAREGIAFLDEEGTFLYTNPAYADVYGYERGELVGDHWEVLYPDDNVTQVYEDVLPSISDGGTWSGENVQVRRDGTRLLVSHQLTYSSDGTLLCLIRDITEEKETERTLAWERQRFEEFVDAVEEYAIFTLDTEGFVTSWNRGAERLKGYTTEEILGEHFSTFYPDEKVDAGYPDELLDSALETVTATDEGWRVRKDGSEFWADVTITAVFDDDDRHQGFLKVTRDTTQQRQAQRTLEADQAFVDQALNILDDIFYVLDEERNIVRATDRAVEITGYDREELLSMSPLQLFLPADRPRIRADIQAAYETGSATITADLLTKDGRTVPFEFRKRRFTDDGNVFAVGIGRDISERKRRERQLERQLEQFDHFGSVLSHDLRNPLNVAQGRLELARETGDDEHLDRAEAALERLDSLIDDLAGVMREGELVRDVREVDLGNCLRSVWESLEASSATLTVETTEVIRADEEALTRLLENLLKNTFEHGGDDVRVTVGCLEDGFYVADDGPGIPESERDRVFEAGYSTKEGSHGFGLASVKQLVVAHGWEITATESDTGGARFEIRDVELA